MSEALGRPSSSSSVSSIPLADVKADTLLVLKAFLGNSRHEDRPGRVGGAYKDPNKYSAAAELLQTPKDGTESPEDGDVADEKKTGFRDLIKRIPRPSTVRRPTKESNTDPSPTSTLVKDGKPNGISPGLHLQDIVDDAVLSPASSTSDEEDGEKKKEKKLRKKNKLKKQISEFFKRKIEKEKGKDKEKEKERERENEREEERETGSQRKEPHPQRPSMLPIGGGAAPAVPTLVSPNHPPEFYEEVAGRLERIAQRSHSTKRITHRPEAICPQPANGALPAQDKAAVVKQLVQVLSAEGDAINQKIQSDPLLRSTLNRLSYASFARLLDTYARCEVAEAPPLPVPASPTLRRVAVTMEVARRVVTATGTQRMQGYAESYMETFTPWVKSQGGWGNIVQMEEYD